MTRFALAAALVIAPACVTASDGAPRHYFDITGVVLDAETREPIERAFVVATYLEERPVPFKEGLKVDVCVRTRGMYTGKDGRYHFPVERLDRGSPLMPNAIKPGYYLKSADFPDENSEAWRKQLPAAYQNRNIYLQKQDPVNPTLRFGDGDEQCWAPKSPEAAAAGIDYMNIELSQIRKYGTEEAATGVAKQLEALQRVAAEAGSRVSK